MIRVPDQRARASLPACPPPPQRPGESGRPALVVLCASMLGIATIGAAHAQTAPARSVPPDVQAYDRDIIVTARRDAADDPETELSEEDIARYGANTIADLLHAVAPLIDGSGKAPILLVNGKRIGGASGIAGFPPEALARLAILPPAAAARYGYAADQRVVNLVLKNKFASWEGEAGATFATAGGRDGERLSASRVVIDGSTYWNAQVQLSRDSMLLRSARPFASRPDPVDLDGHVSGMSGQQIDPALSLIAGRPVSIAGFPSAAQTQPPTLADFAAAAGRDVRFSNPDDGYALLPGGQAATVNIGVTSPIGSFTGSLNANFNASSSIQRLGYPDVSLTLPVGNPWSPFGNDVLLAPDLAAIGPLETRQNTKTLGLSASLAGTIAGWNANLLANYTRSWADSRFDRGVDLADIQRRLDALDSSFDPYAPLPRGLVEVDRSRSRFAAADAKLIVDRAVAKLPAGSLIANLSIGVSRMTVSSDAGTDAATPTASSDLNRSQLDLRASLAAPLARRGQGALGDLSANLAVGATMVSGSRAQRQLDAGMTWSPAAAVQFYGGYSFAEVVPDLAQLNGPRIETIVQIYDPVRQEVARPVWITGGNRDLRKGTRTSLTLKAMWRPLGRSLTLDLGYQQQVANGGIAAFPQLSPAVERAFPDRITRNATGQLIALDARPINIVRDVGEQFTTGVTWLWFPGARRTPATGQNRPPADGWQFTLTVNHSWQLESLLTTNRALPPLDRLNGDGGQPRHLVSMQLMAGRRGMGAILNGQWQSAVRVDNAGIAGGQGDLLYSALAQFNLSLFIEPGNLASAGGSATKSWASDMRVSVDIQNLFDSYQRVTSADGSLAAGYDRYALNPLGRTIQVTLRKRF
jgi:hypothetical protein